MQRCGTSFQMMIEINLHVLFRAVWVIVNDFVCDPMWCNVFPLFCADSERKVEMPCNLCVGLWCYRSMLHIKLFLASFL